MSTVFDAHHQGRLLGPLLHLFLMLWAFRTFLLRTFFLRTFLLQTFLLWTFLFGTFHLITFLMTPLKQLGCFFIFQTFRNILWESFGCCNDVRSANDQNEASSTRQTPISDTDDQNTTRC